MAAVRDASTLETRVIEEWHPWARFAPLRQTGPATFAGEATLPDKPEMVDFVTVHQHTANGSTLTLSSPLLRAEMQ